VRLLLDTHIFLWAVTDGERLTAEARRLLLDADEVYVSAASIWEIAIKAALGRISGDVDQMVAAVSASGFQELPITARHAASVARLPAYHRDPFDRLLVAQAMTEPLVLVTADAVLGRYSELVRVV
jgi:PIN domain nuclease of toxin-antitoxin system